MLNLVAQLDDPHEFLLGHDLGIAAAEVAMLDFEESLGELEHLTEAFQEDGGVDRVQQNDEVLEDWEIVAEVIFLEKEVVEHEAAVRLTPIEVLKLGIVEA